jgi:5'-nucleotidase
MPFLGPSSARTRPGPATLAVATAVLAVPVALLAVALAPGADSASSAASGSTSPAAAPEPAPARAPVTRLVKAQILAINDLHGHLEPGQMWISEKNGSTHGPGYRPAGGAAYLAAKIAAAKKANPASVVVSGGDMIGASPMISGYYHDQPTLEAMNQVVDVGTVGNHEFDEGTAELRRLVHGGCHPKDGCAPGTPYRGITFDLLAANVVDRATGQPILPAYSIKDVGGARIAFIGTVTPDTPLLVNRNGIKDVEFLDMAATVKKYVPRVRAAGADAVVVLTHSGGEPAAGNGVNECHGNVGEAVDLTTQLHGLVDAVISAHTHQAYVCSVKGTMLTSAASYGRLMTTLKLTIDPAHHRVVSISARNSTVTHDLKPDPAVARTVSHYRRLIAPIADRTVGHLPRTANRNATRSGESVLGNIIGDAQLRATRKAGAQLALVAYGLIRTNLEKGGITYGEVYAAQPFGQRLVTLTLTGRQIDEVLEIQFCNPGSVHPDRLTPIGVSDSFHYSYDPKATCGHLVRIGDFRLNGKKMTAGGRYRVTINELFADGQSGFDVLLKGTNRVDGPLDRDALASYLTANPDLRFPHRNRILLRKS